MPAAKRYEVETRISRCREDSASFRTEEPSASPRTAHEICAPTHCTPIGASPMVFAGPLLAIFSTRAPLRASVPVLLGFSVGASPGTDNFEDCAYTNKRSGRR